MPDPRPVLVVGNGERPPDHLSTFAQTEGAELVAVDGGTRWVLRWGLVPDRVLGDLDSLDERSRSYADSYGTPILDTGNEPHRADLARVVDLLIEEGRRHVTFTGCVGPRLDHTLALYAGMARLALAGCTVRSVERWGSGHVAVPGRGVELEDLAGETASFFPLTKQVAGITLSGFDLEAPPERLVPPSDSLVGVRIVSDPVEVTVDEGALLVLVPRREVLAEQAAERTSKPNIHLGTLERTE